MKIDHINKLFAIKRAVKKTAESIIDLIYPPDPDPDDIKWVQFPFCYQCGEPYDGKIEDKFVCTNCKSVEWSLDYSRAAVIYQGQVREQIHDLKYRQQFYRLRYLSTLLETAFKNHYSLYEWDGIIPVPVTWGRRFMRGFNQAEELSKLLSKKTGIPVKNILQKTKTTEAQAHLRRRERFDNLRKAFEVKAKVSSLEGKNYLIVDDVFTTGATLNACAQALKKKGADLVCGLTVARG
jgi:ComF family protein